MNTFKNYLVTEGLRGLGKLKMPKMDIPGKLKGHMFKMARGMNRRNMHQIPDMYDHAKIRRGMGSAVIGIDPSSMVVDRAKKSPSGFWRISKSQVLNIAKKYKFNIPNTEKPMKHLGSTGIQLVRYKPGVFYLYKPRKSRRHKTIRGVSKLMGKG